MTEPPDRPEGLAVTHIESRSAIISWITPYSGNSAIVSYDLEYKTTDKSWESTHKTVQTIAGTDNSFTITGLKPITTYDIRIRAQKQIRSQSLFRDTSIDNHWRGFAFIFVFLFIFEIIKTLFNWFENSFLSKTFKLFLSFCILQNILKNLLLETIE